MAPNSGQPPLAERADIHRSCRLLEALLNILNDYCEAAGAVAALQKKLTKALRETATLRITGEVAANALNASANIFEALSDIDSKFSKVADKEYDAISAEVKRWFKKLAKEEKAHDDRISNANARIKQAGQVYEKKSKRSPRDAAEEHTRYMNLITALGPEISQDKYNHALNVTERHASTTYGVAACAARFADAEWLRTCEGVRRFAPSIGFLGEWRALCEGGWSGPLPQGLPGPESAQHSQSDPEPAIPRQHQDETGELKSPRESTEHIQRNVRSITGHVVDQKLQQDHLAPLHNTSTQSRTYSFDSVSSSGQGRPITAGPSSFEPPRPLMEDNMGSVRSLSAFPSPPTHFPILPLSRPQQQPSQMQSSHSSSSQVSGETFPRLLESPLPEGDDDTTGELGVSQTPVVGSPWLLDRISVVSPAQDQKLHNRTGGIQAVAPAEIMDEDGIRPSLAEPRAFPTAESAGTQLTVSLPTAASGSSSTRPYSAGDYLGDDREFGVTRVTGQNNKAPSTEGTNKNMERSDTGGSTSSIVAVMRNRYSHTSSAASPPPKDVPRLPLSVSDLASRYQSSDGLSSPHARAASPSFSRQLPPPDTITRTRQLETPNKAAPSPNVGPTVDEEATRRRRQRLDGSAERELTEKERQLEERERAVAILEREVQARVLERDHARLPGLNNGGGYVGDNSPVTTPPQSRRRATSPQMGQQRRYSQVDASPTSSTHPQPRYSYNPTHLAPPSLPSATRAAQHTSHSQPTSPSRGDIPSPHAPNCGCETCSVIKYKSPAMAHSASAYDLRPPEKPITLRFEKPKGGWMRRLSMPVVMGNAFSLDSKRNSNAYSLGAGIAGGKNARGGVGEGVAHEGIRGGMAGNRRSYEAGNRSMTNLGRR